MYLNDLFSQKIYIIIIKMFYCIKDIFLLSVINVEKSHNFFA